MAVRIHFADGSRNPDYATPGKVVAINNGRTAGVVEAYRRGTAAKYRATIENAAATHGIPSATIKAMKAPVLVRAMSPADITQDIGDESNAGMTLGMSATEQARNDATRFDATAVEYTEDGRPTDGSLRGFIAAMPEGERQNLSPMVSQRSRR
ncbi:MAG: hypothetical protein IPJ52_01940 [Rhodocyclaceae bacterium]|nr:hypothetical protein [Rhodocyclaceae bacterium]